MSRRAAWWNGAWGLALVAACDPGAGGRKGETVDNGAADEVDCGGSSEADGSAACDDPRCWGPACEEDCSHDGDEDGDGLADCEDADCRACVEDCDNGVDDDGDLEADCADADCGVTAPCWRGVGVRGAGVALRRSVELRSVDGVAVIDQHTAVEVDALWFEGRLIPAWGAPADCWLELRGLSLSAHRSSARGETWTPLHLGARAEAAEAAFAAAPCPAAPLRALEAALPSPLASLSTTGALHPGDLVPLLSIGPDGIAPGARAALRVSAAGPTLRTDTGPAPWARRSQQSAWGVIELVLP